MLHHCAGLVIGDQREGTCAPRQTEDRLSHSRDQGLAGVIAVQSEDAFVTVLLHVR
ncbi:hypothetical protein [Gloeocapsa sp. PCC 7428]|uniref:hypothetical protein n=1 Tax=Gloeocapsa sp. PCC 7428 TaxID=1173026 RepID=UPI0018C8C79F|nr:hypothetical protein [Gloeocapsa sp. PCC 7428]